MAKKTVKKVEEVRMTKEELLELMAKNWFKIMTNPSVSHVNSKIEEAIVLLMNSLWANVVVRTDIVQQ